ncbi:Polyketide cyclase / dehydrase and lipid transport [Asanoa hainanensis]|uniref:Polyketide cyclase / dehydrase and lipid transport n=1 Tax=Asanoa hainanensis TaxID=560556 RepID=A0A239IX69_9ACTN|nr:SRPBCC family protein [Asanoa hainanensis]SNS98149.1 Polyketide cyclase / dehydrase and lipid transport [Asanoa hainanensis]
MPFDRFSGTSRLGAPPAEVFEFLLDPHSYIELAPLIVAVRDIRRDGDSIRYVSVERFRVGPFRWDNPIDVTMTPTVPGHTLRSSVVSPGGVRLESTLTLADAVGGGSEATETIELRSPTLLHSFVLRKAREGQDGRLTALAARFPAPLRRDRQS